MLRRIVWVFGAIVLAVLVITSRDLIFDVLGWIYVVAVTIVKLLRFLFFVSQKIVTFVIDVCFMVAPYIYTAYDTIPILWEYMLECLGNCRNFVVNHSHSMIGLWAFTLLLLYLIRFLRRSPGHFDSDDVENNHIPNHDNTTENLNNNTNDNTDYKQVNEELVYLLDDLLSATETVPPSRPKPFDEDLNLCSVCLDRDRGVAFFPCGHTHTCMDCAIIVMRESRCCPVCQAYIGEFRTVFL